MAIMKMLAVTLIGPKDEMEYVANQMILLGGFQPLSLDLILGDRTLRSKVKTATDNPYDELLSEMGYVWQAAGESLPEPYPVPVTKEQTYEKMRAEVRRVTEKLRLWAERKSSLQEEVDKLRAILVCADALVKNKMDPKELLDTENLIMYFGKLSDDNFKRLEESIQSVPMLVMKLDSWHQETWMLAFAIPEYREGAEKLLDSVYFKGYSIEEVLKTISDNPMEALQRRIGNKLKAIEGLSMAAKKFLDEQRKELERLYSSVYTMQRIYDLCRGRGEIGDIYVLSGWIPEDMLAQLKGLIEHQAPKTTIMIEEEKNLPYSEIRVPTYLRNLPLVRAFQHVVAMYSLPSYGEIDPSFFVAVTFCLFFGFMFGDVGHGLVLGLVAHLLQKKRKMSKSLATVLKAAGCSSVLFGFLYGSIFGFEDIIPAIWMSPMKDMGKMLSLSLIIGVSIVTFGMILNMIVCYRQRDFGRMLFDGRGMAGLFFYLTAAWAIYAVMTHKPLPVPGWLLALLLCILLGCMVLRDLLARILLKERVSASENERGGLYIFEVFHNLLSFLSNTISFLRLAAFALNHVGLSLAVFMLSDMVTSLPGGFFAKIAILVIGNVVIIGLEGLIVFIQTLRLEYYEFFSKFYKGGGVSFKPVRWEKTGESVSRSQM